MSSQKTCSIKTCHHRVDGLAGDESQKVITVTAPPGCVVGRVGGMKRGGGRWARLVLSAVIAAVTVVWAVAAAAR